MYKVRDEDKKLNKKFYGGDKDVWYSKIKPRIWFNF
jgi:hypothetical protein